MVHGSPVSFHLSSLEFNFTVITNLEPAVNPAQADSSDIYKVNLSFHFPDIPEAVYFNTVQNNSIEHLRVTQQESIDIKKRTVKQRECDEWIKDRKNRLGSSVCHRIYVRKRSFNNLAKELDQPFKPLDEMPEFQQRKLKYGIKFEPVVFMMSWSTIWKGQLPRERQGWWFPHACFGLTAVPMVLLLIMFLIWEDRDNWSEMSRGEEEPHPRWGDAV